MGGEQSWLPGRIGRQNTDLSLRENLAGSRAVLVSRSSAGTSQKTLCSCQSTCDCMPITSSLDRHKIGMHARSKASTEETKTLSGQNGRSNMECKQKCSCVKIVPFCLTPTRPPTRPNMECKQKCSCVKIGPFCLTPTRPRTKEELLVQPPRQPDPSLHPPLAVSCSYIPLPSC